MSLGRTVEPLVLLRPRCPLCGGRPRRGMALTEPWHARRSSLEVRFAICRCGVRPLFSRLPAHAPHAPSRSGGDAA